MVLVWAMAVVPVFQAVADQVLRHQVVLVTKAAWALAD
jgi:hypothetical protein